MIFFFINIIDVFSINKTINIEILIYLCCDSLISTYSLCPNNHFSGIRVKTLILIKVKN